MKYFISAGEASGDLHASQLIAALRAIDSDPDFTFLGGDMMAQAVGHEPLIHYRRMAYMGFSEVLRHLPDVFRNLATAKEAISAARPDAVVLVDYPGFNLKLAEYASRLGIPVYYYISPKVWAWKEWRVKTMRRTLRRIYSILPFEVEWFSKRGVAVDYVGNPSQEEVDRRIATMESADDFLTTHHLPADRPILALVPGSRRGEIRNNLPIMDEVARRHPEMTAVVAGAPGIDAELYSAYTQLPVITGCTFSLMRHATAALVTSGTATLECALAGTPQVVCYRANGSRLSYALMKPLIKAPFVSLPNLIAGRQVIPELLLHHCTPDTADGALRHILPGTPGREEQLEGYRLMRSRLGTTPAAATTAGLLYNDLTRLKTDKQS